MPTDYELAMEIAEARQPYVGKGGSLIPNVALAVEAGIALGRRLARESWNGGGPIIDRDDEAIDIRR